MTRTLHIAFSLLVFALMVSGSHLYLFSRVAYYLQLSAHQRLITLSVIGILGLLCVILLPVSLALPRGAGTILIWAIFTWMGIAFLMLMAVVATDAAWIATNLFNPGALADPLRAPVVQRAFGIAALGVSILLAGVSTWNALRPVMVKPITITLDRLPQSFDGFRIVQITDLHIGAMTREKWLSEVVEKVNALKPDAIVITGDLVDGPVHELRDRVSAIADLKAPYGTTFVTGNHEYYSGVDDWCAAIASFGVRVLRNDSVAFTSPRYESITLAGIDDARIGGDHVPQALAQADRHHATILLSHQPAVIDEASAYHVDLVLAGHTHGGQIWPFNYVVYLQQPYVEGLHRHKNTATQIYVSPGTGYWGPPMRLGNTAEITLITLHSPKVEF